MSGLYQKGKYPHYRSQAICGNTFRGATCIIDNEHPGRDHWGPDEEGIYHQWAAVGKALASQPRPKVVA